MKKQSLNIDIPLFYVTHAETGNGPFPECFPFTLSKNEVTGLPHQEVSSELVEVLDRVYSEGTMMIGSMHPDDSIGMGHAADCLSFTLLHIGSVEGMRILEIGCGLGHVLSELSSRGGECVGLEPGEQINEVEDKRIEKIQDFFPSPQILGRQFDLVTSFNVIEHVQKVKEMFQAVHECLVSSGDFIFCVPNCGPYLENGDISILLHEHINYFSEQNITQFLRTCGFAPVTVEVSANQSLLLVHAKKSVPQISQSQPQSFDLKQFSNAMQSLLLKLEYCLKKFDDEQIAVYCPNRALNNLCQLGRKNIRIVDDTPNLLGRHFPYFSRSVENFESLCADPPKIIIIFSYTYAELLKNRCRESPELREVEVFAFSDFYGQPT